MGRITRAELNTVETVFASGLRVRAGLSERDAHLTSMIDATLHVLNRRGLLVEGWESKIDTREIDNKTVLGDTQDNSNKEQ